MADPSELDRIAETYDAARDFDGVLSRFAFDVLQTHLQGARVLEMGCSSGVMTAMLANTVRRLEVVDGSQMYLDAVRERLGRSDVAFHRSLFEDFAPEGTFSDVILARALEHLDDPKAMLARIRGWLAAEGLLHVIVPNALSFHRLVGVAMGILESPYGMSERDRLYGHLRVYDEELLRNDIEASGYAVIASRGVMIKFLPNAAMANLDPGLLRGYADLASSFGRHAAELYAVCRPRA